MDREGQDLLVQHVVTGLSCIYYSSSGKFSGKFSLCTIWFRISENTEDSIMMKTGGKGMKEIQSCLSFL